MSVKLTDIESDLEQLSASIASGRPIDSDLKKRIQERSEIIRQKRFEREGFLNVAVDLVREVRAE